MAFIVSNSDKTPPTVFVQNEQGKTSEAILGGYTWKVFGSNIIADSINLDERDYSSNNTIVSKTEEVLTISTSEKFSVQEIYFLNNISKEKLETITKTNEVASYFTVNAPKLEGTYLCIFKLGFGDRGTAEYAIRVVVTDESIYEVKDIIKYSNTNVTDMVRIKDILNNLPYSENVIGITVNAVDDPKSINIKYENATIDKEDLLNNTVALYALIPEVDFITYESNMLEKNIYYSRHEVNSIMGRNVLEYSQNSELWIREVIYKDENFKINNHTNIYNTVIFTSLATLSEKEFGQYVAIDLNQENYSGEIALNEFDKKELLNRISNEYENVLIVDDENFEAKEGLMISVYLNERIADNSYVISTKIKSVNNKIYNYNYLIKVEGSLIEIEEYPGNNKVEE